MLRLTIDPMFAYNRGGWRPCDCVKEDVCDAAAKGEKKIPVTRGRFVSLDHELYLAGLTHGLVASMKDGRDPRVVAQEQSGLLKAIYSLLYPDIIERGGILSAYGLPRLPFHFEDHRGATGRSWGESNRPENAAQLAEHEDWINQYQEPIVRDCHVITPTLYVHVGADGSVGKPMLEWMEATIAQAKRVALMGPPGTDRAVIPYISPRHLGFGRYMHREAWRDILRTVRQCKVDGVILWEYLDWPITCACSPDSVYPVGHKGRAGRDKFRVFIDEDLRHLLGQSAFKVDWSLRQDELEPMVRELYRKVTRPYLDDCAFPFDNDRPS